ncbi:DUF4184 family protein [Segetibacter aerophilus]|uniref:DUF4184 family protein n=1 Tax=Segetibacter aerophilus TaxID=670293 RepID=UPI00147882A6|nr:DUF4184 family protein [Segetibacter aerophilus]
MPFTFSHPAVVLPLTYIDKRKFSVTALTIGSITPDFEYFANFQQQSNYSHTWLGVFWFNLPVSILLYVTYNRIVKNELIDSLPRIIRSRVNKFRRPETTIYYKEKLLIIFTSLLIGIVSHLFWDKFLHRSVRLIEEPMDYYPIYWDVNSIAGAVVIAFIIWKLPKSSVPRQNILSFWFLTLAVTIIVLMIRSTYSRGGRAMEVSLISGILIGVFISSLVNLFWQKRTRRKRL